MYYRDNTNKIWRVQYFCFSVLLLSAMPLVKNHTFNFYNVNKKETLHWKMTSDICMRFLIIFVTGMLLTCLHIFVRYSYSLLLFLIIVILFRFIRVWDRIKESQIKGPLIISIVQSNLWTLSQWYYKVKCFYLVSIRME